MATRYWRGGTGTWTTTATTNWASSSNACTFTASRAGTTLTVTAVASGAIAVGMSVWHTSGILIGTITAFGTGSGGVGTYTMSASGTVTSRTMSSATIGASAPTTSDLVVFDANSNVGTAAFAVTTNTSACGGMSVSGLDGVMTWAGVGAMTIAGSLSLPVAGANFTRTYTGVMTFTATATITTNGVALGSAITFNNAAATFTLGSALTTSAQVTLTSGALSLGTYTLTTTGFLSSNSNTRSIDFGTGKIAVSGTSGFLWSMPTWTNFTLSGTPVVEKLNQGGTISHGPTTGADDDYTKAISVQSVGNVGGTYSGQFRNFQSGGTVALSTRVVVYGDITLNTGTVLSGVNFTLRGGLNGSSATQQVITTNGVSLVSLLGSVATVVLGSNLTATLSLQGIIDTADFDVFTDTLSFSNGSFLRSSTVQARVVNVQDVITPGTSTIVLNGQLNGGLYSTGIATTVSVNDVVVASGTTDATTTINGNLSFNRFYNQSTVPHTISFYYDSEFGGQYYSFSNFDASGTATAQLTLTAAAGGSVPTLSLIHI